MDKNKTRLLLNDIDADLAKLAKKYGLSKLKTTSAKFWEDGVKISIEGMQEGSKTKEESNYILYQMMLDLPELGTRFTFNGKEYETCGLSARCTNVHIRDIKTNKVFLMKVDNLKRVIKPLTSKIERVKI